jgi:hypothetical protein
MHPARVQGACPFSGSSRHTSKSRHSERYSAKNLVGLTVVEMLREYARHDPAGTVVYELPDFRVRPDYMVPPGRSLADASGHNFNFHLYPEPDPIDSGIYTTLVGEFQNSESFYGTFDQGGNVMEFTETIYDETSNSVRRAIRGGSFGSNWGDMVAGARQSSPWADPQFQEGSGTGFRVIQLPEPATLSLLALGGLALLRRPIHQAGN